MKEMICNDNSSLVLCHEDVFKDNFWDKEKIDFD